MQSLPLPPDPVIDVFRACVGIVRNTQLKAKFRSIENTIQSAVDEYQEAATNSQLFAIATSENVGGIITTDEMTKLYNERMVRTNTPGREYYDKIMGLPQHGRCPLCGYRLVSGLDHYLAKNQHPVFAVTPLNLVPSCSDCNKAKEHHYPVTQQDQTLHPYFDNIEQHFWLIAVVQEEVPVSLKYEVAADIPDLDNIMATRIRTHFEVLELAKLYGAYSAGELVAVGVDVRTIFPVEGLNGVRAHL